MTCLADSPEEDATNWLDLHNTDGWVCPGLLSPDLLVSCPYLSFALQSVVLKQGSPFFMTQGGRLTPVLQFKRVFSPSSKNSKGYHFIFFGGGVVVVSVRPSSSSTLMWVTVKFRAGVLILPLLVHIISWLWRRPSLCGKWSCPVRFIPQAIFDLQEHLTCFSPSL